MLFQDTDIIVWDTVAEVGVCRLMGHRGPVTQLAFMTKEPVLLSSSKDTFVKFWDLNTHHCFRTLTGHHTEVWGMALVKDDQYLVTGCGDAELRVWKLSQKDENKSTVENIATMLEITTIEETDDPTVSIFC